MLPQLMLVVLIVFPDVGSQPKLTRRQQRAEVEAFAKRRADEIKDLLSVAKDNIGKPGRVGVTAVAIRKLGRMRAVEATDFLVDHLSFDGLGDEATVSPLPVLEELSPCVFALAEIGLPAFPRLIREIEGTEAAITHRLAAMVLRRSMGETHALLLLQHQQDSQKDESKKRRLKSTMELLKEVKDLP